MEESGPAVLDRPSPGLSLAPVQQLKRKQGKLHKETSSCSLAALTGGWGEWAISNFLCHPMLCLMCDLYMLLCPALCVCPLSEGLSWSVPVQSLCITPSQTSHHMYA